MWNKKRTWYYVAGLLLCLLAGGALTRSLGVSSLLQDKAIDPDAYKAFMAGELSDIHDLDEWFAAQQLDWMPLLPPSEDFILCQPSGLVLPFDWTNFPSEFNKYLELQYLQTVPAYKVTVLEDSQTRTIRFLNAKGEVMYVLESDLRDYQWMLKTKCPALFSGLYSAEYVDSMTRLYDSARLQMQLTLIPSEYAEPYLYVLDRLDQASPLNSLSANSLGIMLLSSGGADSNIVFLAHSRTNTGNRMLIGYPDAFTNRLDIFTCSDLMEKIWHFAGKGFSTVGTNRLTWVDTNYWAFSGPSVRFYAAGNADLDSDGDGCSDAAEWMVYLTDSTDSNSRPVRISGAVMYSGIETGAIYVLAVRSSETWSPAGSVIVPGPGAYTNEVGNQQSYWFKAFRDVNTSYLRDEWEPWGIYSNVSTLITGDTAGLNIVLWDQPSIWGSLSYTGSIDGDVWVIAATAEDSWDTGYNCVIPWMQEGISGEVSYTTFPVAYSLTGLPATNYWIRAFVDANTNSAREVTERMGQYGITSISVSNRRTGIDFSLQDPPAIDGEVSYTTYSGGQTGPIYILAVAASNSCSTNYSAVLAAPGTYQILGVPPQEYWIWAWRDSDGNKTCGMYEARGYFTNQAVLVTGQLSNVNIVMTDPDTDGDELGDWWEMEWFDVLMRQGLDDDDGDHLMNLYEYHAGTDPTAGFEDTDGDGMSDDWEKHYGFDRFDSADADQDADQDGFTNLEEFNAITDPTSAASRPGGGRYVATNGTDDVSCGSYTNPYQTISFAFSQASNGDHIIILPGIYTGTSNRDMDFNGKNLTVTGLQGQRENTVIDCESAGRAFRIHNGTTNAIIKNLHIQNGYCFYFGGAINSDGAMLEIQSCTFVSNSILTGSGGALYGVSGSYIVRECSFRGNSGNSDGGAFYLLGSTALVSQCIFNDNYAVEGGAIYAGLPITIDHSVICGNRCGRGSGGGIYSESRLVIEHSLLKGNGSDSDEYWGGAILSAGDLSIVNCTLIDTNAASSTSLIYLLGTGGLANCILSAANNRIIEGGTWGAEYSCIQGDTLEPGAGNINDDPQFQPDGWHLMPSSPCLNSGTNLVSLVNALDIDGNPRAMDGMIDMGADEVEAVFVSEGSANPVAPYLSWATAASNIQDAIDVCTPYMYVLVSNGVYDAGVRMVGDGVANRVVLTNGGLIVQSVNGPTNTFIVGSGLLGGAPVRCAYVGTNCMLDGFTLSWGRTDSSGGALSQDGGGAWCAEGASLKDCIIADCSARYGGGIYGCGDSTILRTVIQSNSANAGGGIFGGFTEATLLRGNVAAQRGGGALGGQLRSCLLYGNSASIGGGVCSSVVENCTICDNHATQGGGVQGGALLNCIVYFNSAANWDGGVFTNCCTTPFPSGINNRTSEPGFSNRSSGAYSLRLDSICRDAGAFQSWMANARDLVDSTRICRLVDMGAYEYMGGYSLSHMPSYDQRDSWGVTVVGATTRIWSASFDLNTNLFPLSCWFDFGDGQQSSTVTVWNSASARYIGSVHVYSTVSDYTVSTYFHDNLGGAFTQSFLLACRDTNDFDAHVLHAIEDGLVWLYTNAIEHPNGYYWQHDSFSSNVASANGMAITAFAAFGHQVAQGNVAYAEAMKEGLRYLLTSCLRTKSLSPANCLYSPDLNENGLGISISITNFEMYELGSVMTALVGAGDSANHAPSNAPINIRNRPYNAIMQDMVEYCGWAQEDYGVGRGGWRYTANHGSADNSASWWPAVGLYHAEACESVAIPDGLRDELTNWVAYSQSENGSFGYTGPGGNSAQTAYGLAQLAFLNRPFTNAEVQAALNFLNTNSLPAASDLYGMHAFAEACDMYKPPVEMIGLQSWRYVCATQIMPNQNADGNWMGSCSVGTIGRVFGTAAAISILTETAPDRIFVRCISHVPWTVYTNNSVGIQAVVLPRSDLTNLVISSWYRTATTNSFVSLPMTNSAYTYYTTTSIPAQPAQTKVEYYLLANYSRDGMVVTQRYPSAHSEDYISFTVNP